ncbi:MAG: DUF3943 domain-containing protein [Prevotellaceae bacterium]|jgi:hypothetical protein|nr:DUF3943 domain-containing protein [Prevotellaceae bacterium]
MEITHCAKTALAWLAITILSAWNTPLQAQRPATFPPPDSIKKPRGEEKNYWRPVAEITGLNAGVWAFDRYILNEEGARISIHSIRNNLGRKFILDNDSFSTNLFSHPYHGGLYFNTARANGMNFWQSIPFAVFGSYMWETVWEKCPPSLNDIIATPLGGMAMGEVTHRLSHLLLDDSKRGWARFLREFLAGIISPADLLNRALSGKAWKYHPPYESGDAPYLRRPFQLRLSVANGVLAGLHENKSAFNMNAGVEIDYGEPFSEEPHSPYDCFKGEIDLRLTGRQPFLSAISLTGLLWGKEWNRKEQSWLAGVFQHFDYYDSNPVVEGGQRPYKFAETASFGAGLMYAGTRRNSAPGFTGELFANLVLLGAGDPDNCAVDKRNYHFGNGYSLKFNGAFSFGKKFDAAFGIKHYRILTTKLERINFALGCRLSKHIRLSAERQLYFRHSHRASLPDVSTRATESRLKITCILFDK